MQEQHFNTAYAAIEALRSNWFQTRGPGPNHDFYFAEQPGKWKLLHGDADGRILSTHVAGGFVGTMFGLYAYRAPTTQ
ncbi:MAG: hypothetical protein ABI969_04520 [bacterium]